MPYGAVQRVIVRMLFDPAFRQAVYDAPHGALAGLELTPDERAALVEPDPRAYGTDPFRRSRALHGLLEEYPVSGWLAGRALGDVRRLTDFFSSPFFHDCIQHRGSLAAAFGKYLERGAGSGTIRDSRVTWTAALEAAIATLRRVTREPDAGVGVGVGAGVVVAEAGVAEAGVAEAGVAEAGVVGPETALRLSSRHAMVTVAGGTSDVYLQVRAHLTAGGRTMIETLLAEPLSGAAAVAATDAAPVDVDCAEALLLEQLPEPANDITIEIAHSGLAALLDLASTGAAASALWAAATHHGATPEEARDIVDGLVADGLLVPQARVAPPAPAP